MLLQARFIDNANIGETALPNLALESKFLFCAKGKASFDQLHALLNAYGAWKGEENVHVIRHNYEIVNCESSSSYT